MLPVYLYGAISNSLILMLIYLLDTKVIKDRIFIGSINYITGLFLFPVLWNYEYKFFVNMYGEGLYGYLFLISLPISLYAFQIIKDFYIKTIGKYRFVTEKESAKEFVESQAYLRAYKVKCLSK